VSARARGRVSPRPASVPTIAVVGAGTCDAALERAAEEVGQRVAEAGCLLVCGGLGGVMAAACRGAHRAGGTTVGLLPGDSREDANPWVSVALPTGLGELRNALVVRAADAVVAVGGEYGTLSEIALALKLGTPVVGLGTWQLKRPGRRGIDPGVREAHSPAAAVSLALELVAVGTGSGGRGDAPGRDPADGVHVEGG
jgi:uncharacterized protein (TIGR00725 family)